MNIIHRSLSGATEIVHPVSMRRRSIQPSCVQVYFVVILRNDYVSFDIELAFIFVCVTLYGDLVLLVSCKGIRRIIDFTSSRNKPGPWS